MCVCEIARLRGASRKYTCPELDACVFRGPPYLPWLSAVSTLANRLTVLAGIAAGPAELKEVVKNVDPPVISRDTAMHSVSQSADWPGKKWPVPSRNYTERSRMLVRSRNAWTQGLVL